MEVIAKEHKTGSIKKARWYILQVHSSCERKVAKEIEARFSRGAMLDLLEEIYIPIEEDGEGDAKIFLPGYIMVKFILTDDAWQSIRSIEKVVGFLGTQKGSKPSPVSQKEIDRMINSAKQSAKEKAEKKEFKVGDIVEVKEGPFASFSGEIEEIDEGKKVVRLSVSIFGRVTPVELSFFQIKKQK